MRVRIRKLRGLWFAAAAMPLVSLFPSPSKAAATVQFERLQSALILNEAGAVFSVARYIVAGISFLLLVALLIYSQRQRKKRRQSEAELALVNERLLLAMEAGRSVGWDWDIKSGRDRWFGDLKTIFGISSDTYSGRVSDFWRRVHPEDWQFVAKAVAEARQSHQPYAAEYRVIREDETVRWISARGRFYYAENGDPVRMLGMAVDITERRQAENAVSESEQRFRLVANTAPVMIWMSDPDHLCTFCNQTWLDFTGRPLGAELGLGWTKGIHLEDVDACMKTCQEMFEQRKPFELQYRLRRHDGEYRWILDTGVPRFDADGSFAGYIGSCKDITDRKLAEEALSSIGRRLIEAHEEERTWIGRELHDDIVQRLALVAVDLDQCVHLTLQHHERNDRIDSARSSIEEIARDIQRISRRLHSSKLEYLGLTAAARSFCKELSEQQKVKIDFNHSGLPPNLSKEVSLCLFRVLQEALQNAIKHSGARHFKVELFAAAEEVQLTVSDAGVGFDLLEAVNRGGVGLTSMQQRIQWLRGVFSINSVPGCGTTVAARVPLKTETKPFTAAESA